MKRLILLALILASLEPGCAAWTLTGGKYVSERDKYEVELPNGWRRPTAMWDALRLTRDGEALQVVKIHRVHIDKDAPHTKRKFMLGMLPQEVAEVVIDDFRSNPNIGDHQVIENVPAKVGGHPGFRMVYTHQTKKGLKRKGAYYGVLVNDWYYYLVFEAPARYYFSKDHQTFERLKETFKITAAIQ